MMMDDLTPEWDRGDKRYVLWNTPYGDEIEDLEVGEYMAMEDICERLNKYEYDMIALCYIFKKIIQECGDER